MLEAAQVLSNGNRVEPAAAVLAPYQIIFEPTPEIKESYKVQCSATCEISPVNVGFQAVNY